MATVVLAASNASPSCPKVKGMPVGENTAPSSAWKSARSAPTSGGLEKSASRSGVVE
jgi:hypothetical protein